MPTFQSIPIHPSVRSRLLNSLQLEDNATESGVQCDQSHQQLQQQQQQRRRQPARSNVLIPRSLLTRDPHDLVDLILRDEVRSEHQRAGIFSQIQHIRCQVAQEMISRTRNGKRLKEYQYGEKHMKRRQLVSGGSISILDAWNSKHAILWSGNDPQIFSTGNCALDNLIAFPAEYFFEPNDDRLTKNPRNFDIISGETKGIPCGHVLRLSGSTGKTQLALQLVSQTLIQSSQNSARRTNRIRYCYSTAGHSGYSLSQRLFDLVESTTSKKDEKILTDIAKKIEFQSIATVSQLIATIAKLEQECLQSTVSCDREEGSHPQRNSPVSMLVLDALPLMIVEREDTNQIQSLERWLKRLARNHFMLIVITTTTGVGGSSSIYDSAMSPDLHLELQRRTPTTLSIRLMRHPAKPVTARDQITCTPQELNI